MELGRLMKETVSIIWVDLG